MPTLPVDPNLPETLQRILLMLAEQGKQQKDLCKYVGISPASFTRWKSGDSESYETHIYRIAEFLEETPDYLHGDDSAKLSARDLSKTEIDIIYGYRKMSYEKRKLLVDLVGFLKDEG